MFAHLLFSGNSVDNEEEGKRALQRAAAVDDRITKTVAFLECLDASADEDLLAKTRRYLAGLQRLRAENRDVMQRLDVLRRRCGRVFGFGDGDEEEARRKRVVKGLRGTVEEIDKILRSNGGERS